MSEKKSLKAAMGNEDNYPNFLAFFQAQIDKLGVGAVLNEYLFKGDECAESMLSRLFGGLVHPFIHLGFGIEFEQPAIVAQALAQTAVHEDYMGPDFLVPAEKKAAGANGGEGKTMMQILDEIRGDRKLRESVKWSDGNKIRDGVLARAPDEMFKYAAQFTVPENRLEEKMVETIDTVGEFSSLLPLRIESRVDGWKAYYTSAAQQPGKEVKFDFFYIHCMNASIFLPKILALPSIDVSSKVRLLEWKGRVDLLMYVSRAAFDLHLDEVTKYPASQDWKAVFAKSITHPQDDGHAPKLMRALAHGEQVCRPFEAQAKEKGLAITGDMWLKIGNMGKINQLSDMLPDWLTG